VISVFMIGRGQAWRDALLRIAAREWLEYRRESAALTRGG